MRISGFGHVLFGIGVAGLAFLSLIYGNFVALMEALPGPKFCTYALGAVLLAASAGLFLVRTARVSAITIAVYALVWAIIAARPILLQPLVVGSWYNSCEGVSMLVGAWILYTFWHPDRRAATTGDRARRVAGGLFGVACVVFGVAHFAYASYTEPFVPTWLPGPMTLVYITGACHVAAGVGLLVGVLPRLAATLEATMITLFGVLVWLPSFFAQPVPKWAGSLQNQWSETFMNFLLAGTAWLVAESLRSSPWGFKFGSKRSNGVK